MKQFFSSLRPAFFIMIFFTLLLGVVYPLFIWGIGQFFLPDSANGSLIRNVSGQVIGSENIGQNFTSEKYFHPRPSAAGTKGYDAANSSGSNLGPTSKKLIDAVRQRTAAYRVENKLSSEVVIPAEAVTASGSGLDPHISVEDALLQASRIASARKVSIDSVKQLIAEHTEDPYLGLFGHNRVNVLLINLALDNK